MNFEFAEFLNPELEKFNFSGALAIAETALKKIPETPFHSIIGKSFEDQTDYFVKMAHVFFNEASTKMDVQALYFEINEFDVSPDSWYITLFAYRQDKGLKKNPDDMYWLMEADLEYDTCYEIPDFENIQQAFKKTELKSRALMDTYDWCEQIIIIRFMEFMRAAHVKAAEKKYPWAKVPVYFTENGYEFIVRSVNE